MSGCSKQQTHKSNCSEFSHPNSSHRSPRLFFSSTSSSHCTIPLVHGVTETPACAKHKLLKWIKGIKKCKNLLILFSKTRFLTLSMVFEWGKSVKKKMKKFEKN
jgi:hypothetical protein